MIMPDKVGDLKKENDSFKMQISELSALNTSTWFVHVLA